MLSRSTSREAQPCRIARRRFVAAGAAVAHRLSPDSPSPSPPGHSARQCAPRHARGTHVKTRHQQGVRRCGHLGRPGGLEDRSRGAQARRQRRRRGRRDRGRARRHRALQLGHRRRRLLRPLRRPHRQGRDHRRPRDRAAARCRTTRSSTRRPASPTTSPRSWSPAASRSVRRDRSRPGSTALTHWGTTQPRPGAAARRRGSPTRGFNVDHDLQPADQREPARFADFPATSKLFLPGGQPPAVGSILRNPDLAATYRLIAKRGIRAFYHGAARRKQIARTAQHPPKRANPRPARSRPATCTPATCARYRVKQPGADPRRLPRPRRLRDGAVLVRRHDRRRGAEHPRALPTCAACPTRDALHHYLEASALAFADRGTYVGDPAYVDVPSATLLSRQVRRRAGLPDRPDDGAHQARRPPGDVKHATTARAAARRPRPAPSTDTENRQHAPT